jgi:hypothetical protein
MNFPLKHSNTNAINQVLCTDLCIVIPFVIALAWSVDGLWLWGETNINDFVTPSIVEHELNRTDDTRTTRTKPIDRYETKFDDTYPINYDVPVEQQHVICYLQINDNIDFTARLLYLVQADYLLLFCLHLIGRFIERFSIGLLY